MKIIPILITLAFSLLLNVTSCQANYALHKPSYLCKEIGGIPQYKIEHRVDDNIILMPINDTIIPIITFDDYEQKVYQKCTDNQGKEIILPNPSQYIQVKRDCKAMGGTFNYQRELPQAQWCDAKGTS